MRWVKNHNLGLEVPYQFGGVCRSYIPDFIVDVDYGLGATEPLHVVVEVKGFRGEDAKAKADAMHTYWVPGVNALGCHGRWAFLELRDPFRMQDDFDAAVGEALEAVAKEERRQRAIEGLIAMGGSDPNAEYIPRRRSAIDE